MSAPITEERLAEIEARANAATPGPWVGDGEFGFVFRRGASRAHAVARLDHEDVRDTSGADLAFIAHTRTDVPALVAEVRRLTAALATVTTERDEVRAAMEEREMDMHQRVRAGYDRTIADSWRAEVVRAVAAERDACAARCDALRAEHAAALDAARREGAEGMRAALIARFKARVEYLRPWAEAEADENGCHAGAWTEALNAGQFTREMALPLDAPGGGS